MSEKVTFVDELPEFAGASRGRPTKYNRILVQLKSRPMEWALIDEFKDSRGASARKWYLSNRKNGWEGVELVPRLLDSDTSELYARYNPGHLGGTDGTNLGMEKQLMTQAVGMEKQLMTQAEVSNRLKVDPRTLGRWRSSGEGPRYVRLGRGVRYEADELEAWISDRKAKSISPDNIDNNDTL